MDSDLDVELLLECLALADRQATLAEQIAAWEAQAAMSATEELHRSRGADAERFEALLKLEIAFHGPAAEDSDRC